MRHRIRPHVVALALSAFAIVALLVGPSSAKAQEEPRWMLELALGPGLSESNHLTGLGALTVGTTFGAADHFVLRAALGVTPVADRHGVGLAPLARAEAAARLRWGSFVPLFGIGATAGVGFSGHALVGGALDLNPRWAFGYDLRGGLGFDRDGATPMAEFQFRVTRSF